MGKAPSSPNPITIANSQTGSNIGTAIANSYLNNSNQTGPFGSITNTVTGSNRVKIGDQDYDIPQWTQNTTLDPYQRNIYETGAGIQHFNLNTASQRAGVLRDTLNQNVGLPEYQNFQSGPKLQTTIRDAGNITNAIAGAGNIQRSIDDQGWGQVQRVEDALFSRLNPQVDRQRQQLETSLVNRGIRPGSAAYAQEMETFNQGLNDQRTSILLNAGQEQNRLQQLDLNSGNFANAAQAQQFGQNSAQAQFGNAAQAQRYGQYANNAAFSNQANQQMFRNAFDVTQANNALQDSRYQNQLSLRSQLLNEQSALMSGNQVQSPTFNPGTQVGIGGTDVAGIANQGYANQMNAYNANQGLLGGLFSAGASLIPLLSDRRAKTDIVKIGQTSNGLGWYEFRYLWDREDVVREGLMADEVSAIRPEAVVHDNNKGYDVVYYDMALEKNDGLRNSIGKFSIRPRDRSDVPKDGRDLWQEQICEVQSGGADGGKDVERVH